MTDLQTIIPGFAASSATSALEKNLITTTDLLVCDAVELAKRTGVGVLDLRAVIERVKKSLRFDLPDGDGDVEYEDRGEERRAPVAEKENEVTRKLVKTGEELLADWKMISMGDERIDAVLGGGVPAGYITEITGESGAGKTQFLLSLLLTAQLPPPHGLSRPTLYISTESALPTTRLRQMLTSNPLLSSHQQNPRNLKSAKEKEFSVSLDNIHSIVTPDLESQDHILRYQVPVFVARHNIGLIVLDSVAANYRAEFERGGSAGGGANMAKRSGELMQLGELFRDLARRVGCAVVVANQVSDRFKTSSAGYPNPRSGLLGVDQGESGARKRKRIDGDGWAAQSSPLAHRGSEEQPMSSLPVDLPSSGMVAAAELGIPHPGLQAGSIIPTSIPTEPKPNTEQQEQQQQQSRNTNALTAATPTTPLPNRTPNHHKNRDQNPALINTTPIPNPNNTINDPLSTSLATRDLMTLDHQQRFFTGWGDDPPSSLTRNGGEIIEESLKTPSLGLVWSTQIACRIVLKKRAIYEYVNNNGTSGTNDDGDGDGEEKMVLKGWKRWLRVVFAPWCAGGLGVDRMVEYVIGMEGIKSISKTASEDVG